VTVLVLTPGIAFAISGKGEVLAQAGSILAVLTMALFAFVVLRHGVGGTATNQVHRPESAQQPAE
jgi:hypothetical protein